MQQVSGSSSNAILLLVSLDDMGQAQTLIHRVL